MMKIHTTQNLNALNQQQQQIPAISVSGKEFRLGKTKLNDNSIYKEPLYDSISFGRLFGNKKPKIKDAKKIVNNVKKTVGDINKEPNPTRKKGDKIIESRLFNWILSKHEFEPVIQAGAAAIICMLLRPLTIMALPAKGKTKEDNTYAASHSIASGFVGLCTAILITAPFKKGSKYVMEVLRKDFKEDVLERLYPHLNIESIWLDKVTKKRAPIEKWLDKNGNKFIDSVGNVQFLPEFTKLADTSQLTYEKILKLDVDWASQKGKSFNDVVLKDGKKLYNEIDMSKLGIVVKEEGFDTAQILLKDIDKEYLSKLIEDSKGISEWGNLDLKSVYDKENKVIDFRKWKDIDGKDWKLDLDKIYVSSPLEEIARRPRITGAKRFDKKDNEYKFVAYFNNGKDDQLGSAITEEIAEAALRNEGQEKLLTWGPDIISRVPVGIATIALIPWALKIFGIEKRKKSEPAKQEIKTDIKEQTAEATFKGKGDPKKYNWLIKLLGKYYGKPVLESKKVAHDSEKLNKIPGKLTEHMMTLGSLVTSSMYVTRTLNNKELDPDRSRTLAINQVLCFIIPTIAAYTVNRILDKKIKDFEHRVSNKMQYARDIAKYEGKEIPKFAQNMKNVKGIRILSSIGVFALIYRYITPVVVTPIANLIGESINTKRAQKNAVKVNV